MVVVIFTVTAMLVLGRRMAHEAHRISRLQKGREAVDLERVRTEWLDANAHFLERGEIALDPFRIARRQGKNLR